MITALIKSFQDLESIALEEIINALKIHGDKLKGR